MKMDKRQCVSELEFKMFLKKWPAVSLAVSVFLLAGCDAVQKNREKNAFMKLHVASSTYGESLKVQYCLDSGKISYFNMTNSISVGDQLIGHKNILGILECYDSEENSEKFESYKSVYEDAKKRQYELFEVENAKRKASGTISQIVSDYKKFIGVTDNRPEVTHARVDYLKYKYCVVNPAYRDSLDLKLRKVDEVQDSSAILKCIKTVNTDDVISISDEIADRSGKPGELLHRDALKSLSEREKYGDRIIK